MATVRTGNRRRLRKLFGPKSTHHFQGTIHALEPYGARVTMYQIIGLKPNVMYKLSPPWLLLYKDFKTFTPAVGMKILVKMYPDAKVRIILPSVV